MFKKIYKKQPTNYRGIDISNTVLKLTTKDRVLLKEVIHILSLQQANTLDVVLDKRISCVLFFQ